MGPKLRYPAVHVMTGHASWRFTWTVAHTFDASFDSLGVASSPSSSSAASTGITGIGVDVSGAGMTSESTQPQLPVRADVSGNLGSCKGNHSVEIT